MMNFRQAFIAAYYFLDLYYIETGDEDIADLVSDMNPFLWGDGGSADPAAEDDWEKVAKATVDGGSISPQQAFQVLYNYLKFHTVEFGFNFEWLMEDMLSKTHNTSNWAESVARAMGCLE